MKLKKFFSVCSFLFTKQINLILHPFYPLIEYIEYMYIRYVQCSLYTAVP